MAGRGRMATLPAWMTQQTVNPPLQQVTSNPTAVQIPSSATGFHSSSSNEFKANDKFSNNGQSSREPEKGGVVSEREKEKHDKERNRDRDRDRERDRDRDREKNRDADKDRRSRSRDRGSRRRSRSRSRSRERSSRKRDRSPSEHVPKWKSRNKQSNFDVKPPDGVILPPIGGVLTGDTFVGGPVGGPGIAVSSIDSSPW
jgi:hypothetical protein